MRLRIMPTRVDGDHVGVLVVDQIGQEPESHAGFLSLVRQTAHAGPGIVGILGAANSVELPGDVPRSVLLAGPPGPALDDESTLNGGAPRRVDQDEPGPVIRVPYRAWVSDEVGRALDNLLDLARKHVEARSDEFSQSGPPTTGSSLTAAVAAVDRIRGFDGVMATVMADLGDEPHVMVSGAAAEPLQRVLDAAKSAARYLVTREPSDVVEPLRKLAEASDALGDTFPHLDFAPRMDRT